MMNMNRILFLNQVYIGRRNDPIYIVRMVIRKQKLTVVMMNMKEILIYMREIIWIGMRKIIRRVSWDTGKKMLKVVSKNLKRSNILIQMRRKIK